MMYTDQSNAQPQDSLYSTLTITCLNAFIVMKIMCMLHKCIKQSYTFASEEK